MAPFAFDMLEIKHSVRAFCLRILVQHKGTGCFLTEDGAWVEEGNLARDFANASIASQFCKERDLKDVQITLRFETGLPDIFLSVI